MKPSSKPFKQKLRKINPILLPTIEKEVNKLLDAKIIFPKRYSIWVANFVPVRKKSGEFRFCVDLMNLNKTSLKDNYPLPNMYYLIHNVIGATIISIIDEFSDCNQISIQKEY